MCNCTDILVYPCHDRGVVFPLINEHTWPIATRATLYLVGLLWCFLGTAIIADTFMCSIEKVTSKTRKIKLASPDSERGYEEIEVRVWNDTVANLTLAALGGSAPEILLSIIEIVGNNFHAGELGPSTIVGSAAFNLFVIIAVCMISIPEDETRIIKSIKVFVTTSCFSVFAYIWLIIILVVSSPDIIDLWEALLTFLFFPTLVILAYVADKDFCGRRKVKDDTKVELGFYNDGAGVPLRYEGSIREEAAPDNKIDDAKMRELIKELRRVNPHLSEEKIARLAAAKQAEETPHSMLWYRINATRSLGGNPRLYPSFDEGTQDVFEHLKDHDDGEAELVTSFDDLSLNGTKAVVEFTATQSAVLDNAGRVKLGIRRYGKTNCRVIFKIETIDGTAEANQDYIPMKKTLVFEKDETSMQIDIEIIDDNEWEPDEVFFVKLAIDPCDESGKTSIIGKKAIQEVTIINDDEPGTFGFTKPSLLFKESSGKALVPVERSNGADGTVTLKWKTEDISAKEGMDYIGKEGSIVFEHGEMSKTIEIDIVDDQESEKDESFKLELTECSEGASLGRVKKTIVTIVNDDDFNGMVSRLVDMANINVDDLRVDSNTWGDQFRYAIQVNGGDIESATTLDYVMHVFTFGFKLVFAFVPPPSIWGGWLCFFTTLIMIGILTLIIGDLAAIFGCLIGLKDSVTAITFVALGTSLPDLFASKTAATMEKTADNSVGNNTGSNCVYVFLGLGLPWLLAAVVGAIRHEPFEVQAGSLGFNVVLFTVFSVLSLGILILRRSVAKFGNAELGGNVPLKYVCAGVNVFLWFLYVILSSLEAYGIIQVDF